jgi:hypothetical protein
MDKIPETRVLIETAKWLVKKGYTLDAISPPKGEGYKGDIKSELENELKKVGYDKKINYSSGGADIIAQNDNEIWKVECKGRGGGKLQTLRNNFDRALASVITYFDNEDKKQFLALAIPKSPSYLKQLTRISKPLRKAINLWILLVDERDNFVTEYKPDDNIEGVFLKGSHKLIREALAEGDFTEDDLIAFIKSRRDQK